MWQTILKGHLHTKLGWLCLYLCLCLLQPSPPTSTTPCIMVDEVGRGMLLYYKWAMSSFIVTKWSPQSKLPPWSWLCVNGPFKRAHTKLCESIRTLPTIHMLLQSGWPHMNIHAISVLKDGSNFNHKNKIKIHESIITNGFPPRWFLIDTKMGFAFIPLNWLTWNDTFVVGGKVWVNVRYIRVREVAQPSISPPSWGWQRISFRPTVPSLSEFTLRICELCNVNMNPFSWSHLLASMILVTHFAWK